MVESGSGSIVALSAATGERLWTYQPERSDVISAVAVSEGVVYALGRHSGLTALDLHTGEHQWTAAAPDGGVSHSLAAGSGIAVVVDESVVRAVDLATGAVQWTLGEDAPVRANQPLIAGDLVYLVTQSRQLVAVSTADGTELLRVDEAFDSNSQNSIGAFDQAPVVLGDLLLIFDRSGEMVAYR